MKSKKTKQVLAIVGIVLLLGLYVVTLVTALMAKPYAQKMFIVSLFCSLVVPVLIYAFILVGKAFGKRDKNSMSLSQLRRMKKEMAKSNKDELQSDFKQDEKSKEEK